jgi:hypothetical protein
MHTPSFAAVLIAAWVAVSISAQAQAGDVPLPLRQSAQCMLKVLKATPEVSESKLGVTTTDGWSHPFLEYRAAEALSDADPIRFDAKRSDRGGYWFLAVKSGLGAPEGHVTDSVIKKWKTQCSVDANVLFP